MLNIFTIRRQLKEYKQLYSNKCEELTESKLQNQSLKAKNEVSVESTRTYINEKFEDEKKYNHLLEDYNKLEKSSKEEIQSIHSQLLILEEKVELQTKMKKEAKIKERKELNNILIQLNKKDLSTESLNFHFYMNKETQKYEVVLSFCQLCGGEIEIKSFDTEIEAWIFCKIKTLNGEEIGNTSHSSCYQEYMEEFCI